MKDERSERPKLLERRVVGFRGAVDSRRGWQAPGFRGLRPPHRSTFVSVTSPVRAKPEKRKLDTKRAWAETRALMAQHKRSLTIGFSLMIVNRLAGLVLPASSKYLIDDVIGKHRSDMLLPLALAALGATVVQAVTGFALSQVVSIAAQGAITNMRKA